MQQSLVNSGHALPEQLFGGRYQATTFFSETSLACYFQVEDTSLLESEVSESGSHYLLCLLKPSLSHHPYFAELVFRVLQRLQTSTVLQPVLDMGQNSHGIWYVSTAPQGVSLSTRIAQAGRQGMLTTTSSNIMAQMVQALEQQLPANTSHGYLEPGAIHCPVSADHCLLLDLPLVMALKLLHQQVKRGNAESVTFHSAYLSPDVALGKAPVMEDDVFSLAAISYQLFNGHVPFLNNSTIEAGLKRIVPPPIQKLSEKRWQVIKRGLSYLPQQRQPSVQVLLKQFSQSSSGLLTKKYLPYLGGFIACLLVANIYLSGQFSRVTGWSRSPIQKENTPTASLTQKEIARTTPIGKGSETATSDQLSGQVAKLRQPIGAELPVVIEHQLAEKQQHEATPQLARKQVAETGQEAETETAQRLEAERRLAEQQRMEAAARLAERQRQEAEQQRMEAAARLAERQRLEKEQKRTEQQQSERARRQAEQKQREAAAQERANKQLAIKQRQAEQVQLATAEQQLQQQFDQLIKAQINTVAGGGQAAITASSYKTASQQVRSGGKLRFTHPHLFGPIPDGQEAAADASCQQVGALKALGYHPDALTESGTPFPDGAYLCAFTERELALSKRVGSTPADRAPKLERIGDSDFYQ